MHAVSKKAILSGIGALLVAVAPSTTLTGTVEAIAQNVELDP